MISGNKFLSDCINTLIGIVIYFSIFQLLKIEVIKLWINSKVYHNSNPINTLKEEKFEENEIPFSSLLVSNPSNLKVLGV